MGPNKVFQNADTATIAKLTNLSEYVLAVEIAISYLPVNERFVLIKVGRFYSSAAIGVILRIQVFLHCILRDMHQTCYLPYALTFRCKLSYSVHYPTPFHPLPPVSVLV